MHGGRSLQGPASKRWRTGLRSKLRCLPPALRLHVAAAHREGDGLLEQGPDIALVDGLLRFRLDTMRRDNRAALATDDEQALMALIDAKRRLSLAEVRRRHLTEQHVTGEQFSRFCTMAAEAVRRCCPDEEVRAAVGREFRVLARAHRLGRTLNENEADQGDNDET